MGRQHNVVAALAAAVGTAALYRAHVRPWIHAWGARPDELTAVLPGDELVGPGTPRTTRAVSIAASRAAVWPWLIQIGEDRGGFYSYSLLERAVGADMHNADSIHPEWQQVRVGDTVWLARRYGPDARQIVAAVKRYSHLVLVNPADYERVLCGQRAAGCWSFILRRDVDGTRLLARGSGGAVGHFWFDIPHFVMEQKMLRGIARRAAGRHRQPDVLRGYPPWVSGNSVR